MSNYTITLKRISEVYSKNEVLGWFQDYSIGDYLTYEESTLVAQTNLFDKGTLANMILMGKLLEVLGGFNAEDVKATLKKVISAKRADMLETNLKAMQIGAEN